MRIARRELVTQIPGAVATPVARIEHRADLGALSLERQPIGDQGPHVARPWACFAAAPQHHQHRHDRQPHVPSIAHAGRHRPSVRWCQNESRYRVSEHDIDPGANGPPLRRRLAGEPHVFDVWLV